jgi:hypothetical protein
MYWEDQLPPHSHAEYSGNKVMIDIQNGTVIKGVFPFKQLKLILAWCEIHRDELLKNWELGMNNDNFKKIEPLR